MKEKNYAMVKLATPKRVALPNGRTFIAQYKRIKRSELPPHIVMRRTSVRSPQKNPSVRSIAKKGLEYAPGVYHNLTKRVKNKTLKRILNSDVAHLVLNKAIKNADRRLGNG